MAGNRGFDKIKFGLRFSHFLCVGRRDRVGQI